ncbi:MAG TPA: DUF2505 domain-containing protein [Actinomycetota bacterium]|nr:DUF2505 domain-containing protein [Actinomycetota bacterium]
MDFSFEHHFDRPLEEVAKGMLDLEYQGTLSDLDALAGREVLSQEEAPSGVTVRRVRCVLGIDLGAARKFIGDGPPAWVEEATWDPEVSAWGWVIHPEVVRELLEAHGTIELSPDGGGTKRSTSGVVKVKVPLYGGKVERVIVDGLRKAYDEEAERLDSWLGARA